MTLVVIRRVLLPGDAYPFTPEVRISAALSTDRSQAATRAKQAAGKVCSSEEHSRHKRKTNLDGRARL